MRHTRRLDEVPAAYVVTGMDARPPVRLRLDDAIAPLRQAGENALLLFVGLWPIWAVLGLGMLLIWASAMGNSP